MFGWFRKDRRSEVISELYRRIGEASRAPDLYLRMAVPDTVEGRLESLMLHAFLVIRRLKALPPPADEAAQDLVDQLFRHIDHGLRELGVGDVSVPKRMKRIAQNFYGRVQVYAAALDARDKAALRAAFERNIPGVAGSLLSTWTFQAETWLANLDLEAMFSPTPVFPPHEAADA